MPTVAFCPDCGEHVRVPDGSNGRKLRCPECSSGFAPRDGRPPPAPPPDVGDPPPRTDLDRLHRAPCQIRTACWAVAGVLIALALLSLAALVLALGRGR